MVSDTGTCVKLDEPPDADPHVRWCERGRLAAAPYSIIDLVALSLLGFAQVGFTHHLVGL